MNKVGRTAALFLILITTLSLMLFYWTPLGLAQSGTNVNGKISSDTTWTQAGSPYTFTGPVAVMSGVTLTIEPGTSVNLASYYLQINGTLNAIGTSSNKIVFSGGGGGMGSILFNKLSPSWNEWTGKGSILQQAIINIPIAIGIGDTAPKIDSCQINGAIFTSGFDEYSGISVMGSSPILTNNIIVESSYSPVMQISTSPIIKNNTIKGLIQTYGGSSFIRGNIIEGAISAFGSEYIADNTIIGESDGFGIRTGTSPLIERNSIRNCRDGILLWYNHPNPTIRNNTISNCTNGLSIPGLDDVYPNPQVSYNNFIDNSQYNVNLYNHERDSSSNINATYNYWGTTDQQVISQKIHDYKNDFNLGNVTYEPFLTSSNPQAVPNTEAPLPTANPISTPTSTPSVTPNPTAASPSSTVPELTWLVMVPLFVATLFAALKIRHWKNNRASSPTLYRIRQQLSLPLK